MFNPEKIILIGRIIRFNLKIIFAGRFLYFLLAAWMFFLVIMGLMLFSEGTLDISDIYATLLFSRHADHVLPYRI